MARAISTSMLAGGNNVNLVGHTPGRAEALAKELKSKRLGGSISMAMAGTLTGEVVILAVPYVAAKSALQQFIDFLPGKILVDITNPINYQTMELIPPLSSSGAEEIAKLAPVNTRVLNLTRPMQGLCLRDKWRECRWMCLSQVMTRKRKH
jgi:predicted dinucleotide-binding enzyme